MKLKLDLTPTQQEQMGGVRRQSVFEECSGGRSFADHLEQSNARYLARKSASAFSFPPPPREPIYEEPEQQKKEKKWGKK